MTTPNPEELKALPCPFCAGGDVDLTDATRILGVWRIIHRCKVVGAISIEKGTCEKVLTAWNTRPEPASVPGEVVERVEELIEVCESSFGDVTILHAGQEELVRDLRALLAVVPLVEVKK